MSTATRKPNRPARAPAPAPAAAVPAEPPTRPAPKQPRLPDGYHLARTWFVGEQKVTADAPMPVNSDTLRLAGMVWVCSGDPLCGVHDWTVGDTYLTDTPTLRFCPEHGAPLATDGTGKSDPEQDRRTLGDRAGEALAAKRAAVAAQLATRRDAAVDRASTALHEKINDHRVHLPQAVATAATLTGTTMVVSLADPLAAAAIGAALAVGAGVIAYAAGYLVRRQRAVQRGERTTNHTDRALTAGRRDARRILAGATAAGVWTMLAAPIGANPATVGGTGMLGLALVLAWVVNRARWSELTRQTSERKLDLLRRQVAVAWREAHLELGDRLYAEALGDDMLWCELAAYAERQRRGDDDVVIGNADDPAVVGAWLREQWERIAAEPDAAERFPVMHRTQVLPPQTRAIMVPIDGEITRIGWEFTVAGDPGVLVPRAGAELSPLGAARLWLAAMLGRDASHVSVVDRPDNDPNRGLLILTDGAPLGGTVKYLGAAGIDRRQDGSIWAVDGRDITGKQTYEPLYIPQQKFGGLLAGAPGGGKSQSVRRKVLSCLYGGILPMLYDPKNFVDYKEFAGIFPMGCTREHRDVLLHGMWAEMVRRQKFLSQQTVTDRFNRQVPADAEWDLTNGPPMLSIWDEFHLEARDKQFIGVLEAMARLERATASSILAASQGGGLTDWCSSVFRDILGAAGLEIFRMGLAQAKLAGYKADYDPSQLPRLPGMMVKIIGEGGAVVPMRSAFIPRGDVDGSVYDHLYDSDNHQILFAPRLPKETIDVFEREGVMDLWNMAKGPGGLERLQAEAEHVGAVVPEGALDGKPADDRVKSHTMILAVLAEGPVAHRGELDAHRFWQAPALGWVGSPDPSSISRARTKLISEKLATANGPGGWLTLTPLGQQAAQRALAYVSSLTRPGATPAPNPDEETPADAESRVQQQAEQDQLIRASMAESTS